MEYSKRVYKRDTKDRIRLLHVYTQGSTLVQESGLLTGEKVVHKSICKEKNIGKSNMTSPEEQAVLEAKSKIENKMSTGYFNTVEEAENGVVILPMLAKSWDTEKSKVQFPCYGQPKLDGMRALGRKGKLISRKGKEIGTLNHITSSLEDIDAHIDGELYAKGLSFQENMKLIKKYREGESEMIKYHVYDIISDDAFINRYDNLHDTVENKENIVVVKTVVLRDEKDLKELHSKNLSEGYEGTIIRHGNEGYKVNGRSSNLLKYKDFQDITCSIVDVVPSEKRPEQGVFVCSMPDGRIFNTGMKFSHEKREKILSGKDKYLGETAEIRFFEYTDDGLPRFPVCVGIRLDF